MNTRGERQAVPKGWGKPWFTLAMTALALASALAGSDDLRRIDQLVAEDPKAAIALAETMLASETDPRRRLHILNSQSAACIWTSDNERAAALAGEAAGIARRLDAPAELGDALYTQATALRNLRRYSAAYEKAMLGLQTFEKLNDREGQARCLNRLGSIFSEIGDNRRAEEYLSRALALTHELGDESLEVDTIGSLAHIYYLKKDYPRMLSSAQQAVAMYDKRGERRFIIPALITVGNAHLLLGNLAAAETQQQRALALAREGKDRISEMIVCVSLARVFMGQGALAAARPEARRSLEIALELKDAKGIVTAAELLSAIDARRGDYRQAYRFRLQAIEAREKLRVMEASASINRSLQQLEIGKKEAEILLLKQRGEIDRLKIRQQRTMGWFQLALALVLLVATAVSVRAYLAKRKANREINALNVRLEALSRTDPLTQALNRRGMMEKLEAEMRRFRRTRQPFALANGDIDDFKRINDAFGHECGDQALRRVAGLMRSQLRETDDLARWGGEEFLLLMPLTEEAGALKAVEQIRAAVAATPLEWRQGRITLTMTFGLGVYDAEESLEQLLERIDRSLYDGKRAGKNRVVCAPRPARAGGG